MQTYNQDEIYLFPQVTAIWQWWNCYETVLPAGKTLLKINMDETAVHTYMGQPRGLVSQSPKHKNARRIGVHVHPAGRKKQRACLTHVAFICDNAEIQPHLPHIFIGNAAVLLARTARSVTGALENNVFLWRRKSAWVNDSAIVEVLEILSKALTPFRIHFQPLLLWDALKSHLSPCVLRAAGQAGLWVVIVPAKLTWLLQPADTHCFAKYKAFLRKKYLEMSSDSVDGAVELQQILLAMNEAVRKVFQKTKWSDSFTANGLGGSQKKLRVSILEHLEWTLAPPAPNTLPTLQQFNCIWPQRLDVPIDALFSAFLPRHMPLRRTFSSYVDDTLDDTPTDWAARLRPRLARDIDVSDAAVSSAARDPPRAAIPSTASWPWLTHPTPAAARPARPGPQRARAIPQCRR